MPGTVIQSRAAFVRVLCGTCSILVIFGVIWADAFAGLPFKITRHLTFFSSCAVALAVAGATFGTNWQRPGMFAGMLIAGHAAALELHVDTRWEQHLPDWRSILRSRRVLFCGLILCQLGFVLWSGRRVWRSALSRLRPRFPTVREACAVLILLAALANGTWYVYIDAGWFGFLRASLLALILALAAALTAGLSAASLALRHLVWIRRGCAALSRRIRGKHSSEFSGRVSALAFLWVLVCSGTLSRTLFEGVPQIPDDVSMYWQARYFAAGALYLKPPPVAESFSVYLTINDGVKWYGHSSPGWPMILAIGFLVRVPWIVNPLIGATSVVLVYRLAERLFGRPTAVISAILLCTSPWYLIMSATYMPHPVALMWMLGALLGCETAHRTGRGLPALGAGVCIGMLLLTRPFEGVIAGAVVAICVTAAALRRRRPALTAAFCLGAIAVGGWILPYNRMLSGSWTEIATTAGIGTEHDASTNRLGFGADRGYWWPYLDPIPGHGWLDVALNANHNLYWLNFEAFGWPCGSLAIILLGFGVLRLRGADWFLLAVAAAVAGGYAFYWFSGGPDYGARYWYLTCPSLAILTASFFLRLFGSEGWSGLSSAGTLRAGAALCLMLVSSLVVVTPWRIVDKYPRRRGMQTQLADLERNRNLSNALVFVRLQVESEHAQGAYRSAFIRNPIDFSDPGPIYARDVNRPVNARLGAAFPQRKIIYIEAPAGVGENYRVLRDDELNP